MCEKSCPAEADCTTQLCDLRSGFLRGAQEQVNEVASSLRVQSRFVRVWRRLAAATSHVVHGALPVASCKHNTQCSQLLCTLRPAAS